MLMKSPAGHGGAFLVDAACGASGAGVVSVIGLRFSAGDRWQSRSAEGCREGARGCDWALRLPVTRLRPRTFLICQNMGEKQNRRRAGAGLQSKLSRFRGSDAADLPIFI